MNYEREMNYGRNINKLFCLFFKVVPKNNCIESSSSSSIIWFWLIRISFSTTYITIILCLCKLKVEKEMHYLRGRGRAQNIRYFFLSFYLFIHKVCFFICCLFVIIFVANLFLIEFLYIYILSLFDLWSL